MATWFESKIYLDGVARGRIGGGFVVFLGFINEVHILISCASSGKKNAKKTAIIAKKTAIIAKKTAIIAFAHDKSRLFCRGMKN